MKENTKYRVKAIANIGLTAALAPALLVSMGPVKAVKCVTNSVKQSISLINLCNAQDIIDAEFSVVEES